MVALVLNPAHLAEAVNNFEDLSQYMDSDSKKQIPHSETLKQTGEENLKIQLVMRIMFIFDFAAWTMRQIERVGHMGGNLEATYIRMSGMVEAIRNNDLEKALQLFGEFRKKEPQVFSDLLIEFMAREAEEQDEYIQKLRAIHAKSGDGASFEDFLMLVFSLRQALTRLITMILDPNIDNNAILQSSVYQNFVQQSQNFDPDQFSTLLNDNDNFQLLTQWYNTGVANAPSPQPGANVVDDEEQNNRVIPRMQRNVVPNGLPALPVAEIYNPQGVVQGQPVGNGPVVSRGAPNDNANIPTATLVNQPRGSAFVGGRRTRPIAAVPVPEPEQERSALIDRMMRCDDTKPRGG